MVKFWESSNPSPSTPAAAAAASSSAKVEPPPAKPRSSRVSGHARFDIPEDVEKTSSSKVGQAARPSATPSSASSSGDGIEEELRLSRRSRYSQIFYGPRTFKSLILKRRVHLTFKIDTSYFTGRAGFLRILTLLLSVATFGAGLPGYSSTDQLYIGYGASSYIPISMATFFISILINIAMIFLLLSYREVRCQAKWDEWNMKVYAIASAIAAIAGIMELIGVFKVRQMNCDKDPRIDCIILYKERIHARPQRPELDMPYKRWHYFSICGKLLCAMLFSFCSRIFLKNNDRHVNIHGKHNSTK